MFDGNCLESCNHFCWIIERQDGESGEAREGGGGIMGVGIWPQTAEGWNTQTQNGSPSQAFLS